MFNPYDSNLPNPNGMVSEGLPMVVVPNKALVSNVTVVAQASLSNGTHVLI
jgi:hypothetical protein